MTATLLDWVGGFAGPAGSDPTSAVDAIARAWAGSVVDRVLDRHLAGITHDTDGLGSYLGSWPSSSAGYDTVAHPAFGRADMLLKGRRLAPVDVAVRLGLRLAECGHPGSWTATLPSPSTVLVGGRAIRQAARIGVRVGPAATSIRVTRADGSLVHLPGTDQASPELPTFTVGRPVTLLSGPDLPADAGSREVFADCLPLDVVDDATRRSFQAGADLIAALVPQYGPWVAAVLRGVVACRCESEFDLTSGSWEDSLGHIHMSSPHCPVDVADTLIHEAAHQYFYLLERVAPMDDGSDAALYYSPATRTKRPISRLLMALHAFVNVLELYEVVRRADRPDTDYVRANLPTLVRDIDLLDTPLRTSTALTDVGRSLYEPVRARLDRLAPDRLSTA